METEVGDDTKDGSRGKEADDNERTSIRSPTSKRIRSGFRDLPWKIYISRGLSAWGDRLWAFGAGIFMVQLAPENLRLVAIYGLVVSVSVIIFGASIGHWIDRSKRLFAAQTFLAVQNISTALSCSILAIYFAGLGQSGWAAWLPDAVPIITILIATLAELASVGSKIVVEKDWIVVISRGDEDRLAQINAVFRTIDLTALSLAPMVAGLIFDLISSSAAAIFIAAWNLASVIIEYWLLASIYKEFPELAYKKHMLNVEQQQKSSWNPWHKVKNSINAWILYMRYPVRNAGLGLALLFMTVLGFDNITYGYCLQQCVRESVLGALVGVSAVLGVSGSITFPFLRKAIGLANTGLVGMYSLVSALSLCIASVWLVGSPFEPGYLLENGLLGATVNNDTNTELTCYTESYLSVGVLLAGIISARFGLWISDLSITQVLQERVKEEHRGVIGGVQNGLNQVMNTIKFVLVIILPEQETFGWLIIASFTFVTFGALSYTSYAVKKENRLSKSQQGDHSPSMTYRATDQIPQEIET